MLTFPAAVEVTDARNTIDVSDLESLWGRANRLNPSGIRNGPPPVTRLSRSERGDRAGWEPRGRSPPPAEGGGRRSTGRTRDRVKTGRTGG